jgi:hypothetical protein
MEIRLPWLGRMSYMAFNGGSNGSREDRSFIIAFSLVSARRGH